LSYLQSSAARVLLPVLCYQPSDYPASSRLIDSSKPNASGKVLVLRRNKAGITIIALSCQH
jgi:hypothetical protein